MNKRILKNGVVFGILIASAGGPPRIKAQSYTVTDIGTLGGTTSYGQSINTSETVVGNAEDGANIARPFIWLRQAAHGYNAGMNALPLPTGDISGVATDVNETDGAVGYTLNANGESRAVLWGNPPIDLGTLPGQYNPTALGLNDHSEVVGYCEYILPGNDLRSQGFLWLPSPKYQLPAGIHAINLLSGYESHAGQDINESGWIVGTATNSIPFAPITEQGFRRNPVTTQLTALPRLVQEAHRSTAESINADKLACGDSQIDANPDGVYHAVKWDANGAISDLGTTGGFSHATKLNNYGGIVGWMNPSGSTRAFWWQDGQLRDLNQLIDPNSGWTLRTAEGISDGRSITGGGIINGEDHAYLLSPNPPAEPAVPAAPHDRKKNRYISFAPNSGTRSVAFFVSRATLPYGGGYVSAPDAQGISTVDEQPTYRVWSEQVIHVGDCEIFPVSTYWVGATDGIFSGVPHLFSTIDLPSLNSKQWGDVVGVNDGFEWTPPNQLTNMYDIVAILAYINDAAIKPHFTVANLQGVSTGNSCLNSYVNTADVYAVVKAAEGDFYGPPSTTRIVDPSLCLPCTGGMPEGGYAPEGFDFVSAPTFDLSVDPYQITAGSAATVDIFLDAAEVLSGYEVSLDFTGGTSGSLTLEAVDIDTQAGDFIFAGHGVYEAVNTASNLAGAVESSGTGMLVTNDEYLATFTLRASGDAYGVFEVTVSDERSFLLDGNGEQTPHDASALAYVRVGVECTSVTHCDDGNPCTSDACTNGVCVNTNLPSGTTCDDGLYCTLTDTCNGTGVCVGSEAKPCAKPNPVCCEDTDSCHPTGFECGLEV